MQQPTAPATTISSLQLFLTFSRITLCGFGGVGFWARRVLVERLGWLTEKEYVELFALGQLIPGPPVFNLTVLVGHRFGGWSGAAAAVSGILLWPCLLVIGMGVLYQRYGALPQVRSALSGMLVVAAALLFSTFLKMAKVLPRRWRPWLLAILAFVGVGVMRWPLFWVLGVLAPLALLAAWKEQL